MAVFLEENRGVCAGHMYPYMSTAKGARLARAQIADYNFYAYVNMYNYYMRFNIVNVRDRGAGFHVLIVMF